MQIITPYMRQYFTLFFLFFIFISTAQVDSISSQEVQQLIKKAAQEKTSNSLYWHDSLLSAIQ